MPTPPSPSSALVDPAGIAAAWLRGIPSLTGRAPALETDDLPADPVVLFRTWLEHAVSSGVAEPHAMTLATVDEHGVPDARTLILKGVGDDGWAFAGHRRSAKSRQLAARPAAALTFWWQPLMRAVRVRGPVVEAPSADSAADLAARSPSARAGIAPEDWALWRLQAQRVEFWQGSPDRNHTRVVFERGSADWTRRLLNSETTADEEESA